MGKAFCRNSHDYKSKNVILVGVKDSESVLHCMPQFGSKVELLRVRHNCMCTCICHLTCSKLTILTSFMDMNAFFLTFISSWDTSGLCIHGSVSPTFKR